MALPKPPRLTEAQKGLGWPHQKIRRGLLKAHIEGSPCEWCGEPMYSTQKLEADHVIPRSLGGTEATRLLHQTCNRKKGDRTDGGLKRWDLSGTPSTDRLPPRPRSRARTDSPSSDFGVA